jgi:hypothetical protein
MNCERCGFSMLEWFLDDGKCPICDEPIPASPFYPPHFGLTEEIFEEARRELPQM